MLQKDQEMNDVEVGGDWGGWVDGVLNVGDDWGGWVDNGFLNVSWDDLVGVVDDNLVGFGDDRGLIIGGRGGWVGL